MHLNHSHAVHAFAWDEGKSYPSSKHGGDRTNCSQQYRVDGVELDNVQVALQVRSGTCEN
jgi:hypothetical protein